MKDEQNLNKSINSKTMSKHRETLFLAPPCPIRNCSIIRPRELYTNMNIDISIESESKEEERENKTKPGAITRADQMGGVKLIVADFIMSFMWVWSSVLIKTFVYKGLGLGYEAKGEVFKSVLSIINMFFFAWLGKATKGGAYNPLTVLSRAISGDFKTFLFNVGARIPAQVIGSVTGVRLILETFPEIGRGPRLNVDIHRGALTEGILTFAIVFISLGLAAKIPENFLMKTWISSVSKLSLHILGSDLTGGCMNPASVMGWAYARGDHITKEHILVYWLAPIEATLLAVWIFRLLVQPLKEEKAKVKAEKSD